MFSYDEDDKPLCGNPHCENTATTMDEDGTFLCDDCYQERVENGEYPDMELAE